MKKRIAIGAALLVVFVAVLGVFFVSTAKRKINSDAVRFLEIGDVTPLGPTVAGGKAATGFVVLTNTTSKAIAVEFPFIEAKRDGSTNYNYRFVFGELPPVAFIGPHCSYREKLVFPTVPPARPWRFRLKVCEELKGTERTFLTAKFYVQQFTAKFQGRTAIYPWNPMVSGKYFGHQTEIVVGEDQDWPKMRGIGRRIRRF